MHGVGSQKVKEGIKKWQNLLDRGMLQTKVVEENTKKKKKTFSSSNTMLKNWILILHDYEPTRFMHAWRQQTNM